LDRALLIGLLQLHDGCITITGIAQSAHILGVDRVRQPVFMDACTMVRQGWFAHVWSAWLVSSGFTERPISRAALRALSGVSERNQRELERRAGVKNIANYAIDMNQKADNVPGIREFKHAGAFAYGENIAWRLPNSRNVQNIKAAPKGATRRINRQLAALRYGLVESVEQDPSMVRLYCKTDKQVKNTMTRIRQLGRKGKDDLPDMVYLFDGKGRGFGMYAAIAA